MIHVEKRINYDYGAGIERNAVMIFMHCYWFRLVFEFYKDERNVRGLHIQVRTDYL